MAYRLDIGLWNQVFAVPCGLVDRHLKLAGKEELQVILYLLRHPGEALEPQALGDALGMPLEKAQEALEYWVDRGLLALQGEELSPVPQRRPLPRRPGSFSPSPPGNRPRPPRRKNLPGRKNCPPESAWSGRTPATWPPG